MSRADVLHIAGEFTIYRAAELKQTLFSEPPATEIDLSGVTELDSAGLQLLMLAKQTAQAQGRELRLTGHSEAVIDVFELLNVAAYFGDPVVMHTRTKPATGSAARSSDGS
ncbi:MAG: STAS domain-containing protein [Burkholderiales bacterium]|nr:STAS domain-containing protein [Burkholderiales bacterium]